MRRTYRYFYRKSVRESVPDPAAIPLSMLAACTDDVANAPNGAMLDFSTVETGKPWCGVGGFESAFSARPEVDSDVTVFTHLIKFLYLIAHGVAVVYIGLWWFI